MHATAADRALDELTAMINAIGPGFHPDTDGEEYTSLPDGYDPEEVNRILGAAYDFGYDVAEIALAELHPTTPTTTN